MVVITREGKQVMSIANKKEAKRIFIVGIETANKTWQEVAAMKVISIRAFIGKEARGLTRSFIKNMQQHQVRSMQIVELQSVADWTLSRIVTQFPDVEVKIEKNRTFKIFLDGLPEVSEL